MSITRMNSFFLHERMGKIVSLLILLIFFVLYKNEREC